MTATVLSLAKLSTACKSTHCERASLVLTTAHESADAVLKAYELARMQRGRPRGMTTDNEQDLLRAMLVTAAAGLDATTKQLVKDALNPLLAIDDKARNTFEKFIARKLASDSIGSGAATRLLAVALAAASPQARLIEEYVGHLTGGSLQSTDSLFEIAAALGADPGSLGLNPKDFDPIFQTRNKIIHELDINLDARMRTRNLRSQQAMMRDANRLLRLACSFLSSVDQRLHAKSQ